MTAAKAAAWAALPTAALLTLNGLYTGEAYRASRALFWFIDMAQFVLVPLASLWALQRFAGVGPRGYGLGPLVGPRNRLATLAAYPLMMFIYAAGYGLARILTLFLPWEWPASAFLYSQLIPLQPAAALGMVAYFALSAALVEEIVFRGLPALFLPERLYPVLSAAAFALIHWESGTREVLATFLLGVVLAGLYLRVRNLWPFVAGHAVTEILAFSGTYSY